jgi:hypothetical protein
MTPGFYLTFMYSCCFSRHFGEANLKRGGKRISKAKMALASDSAGGSCVEELTKDMVQIVEFMLKVRDREALIDKEVDLTMEIFGRFGGKNITKFLATYQNEM